MQLSEFKRILGAHQEKGIQFLLPTGTKIPVHAHVTDVARIEKRFIDCGGTFRTEITCRMQTWFADDTEHRVGVNTLLKVLDKAAPFLETEEMDVEIEHEAPFISQFPIDSVEPNGEVLMVSLGIKHTTCLAQDVCIPPNRQKSPLSFKSLPNFSVSKCC